MSIKRVASTVLIVGVVVLAVVVKSTCAVSLGQGIASSGFAGDATARALGASSAAQAAGDPLGRNFNISNLTATEALDPSIAYNSNRGEYLVVWWNDRPGNDDIYGRRVSGDGALVGDWFAIAAGSGHERQYPDVAYNSQLDEYLVVWQDDNLISGVVSISGRRISATGQPVDGEISIGGQGDANWGAKVAYASTANKYVVMWMEDTWGVYLYEVVGKEVSSTGSPGSRFVIESGYVAAGPAGADLAYSRARNEFLAVWFKRVSSDYNVYGRRIAIAGGVALGPSFPIFQSASDEVDPAVAALPGHGQGQYLVVCETIGGGEWIQGQLVTADGNLEGSPIDVSESSDASNPAVAGSERAGQYLVAWTQAVEAPSLSYVEISARAISIDGDPVGEQSAIGGSLADNAAVAGGSLGDFLVAFDDLPPEGSTREVYGRLWGNRVYLPLVVRD